MVFSVHALAFPYLPDQPHHQICRSMSRYEKQQLQKLIQKLPPKNLSRIAEIVQRSKAVEMRNADEVFVDLDQEVRFTNND